MKLEDQACSLELAKKLKELGVKQGSLYYWFKTWWESGANGWHSKWEVLHCENDHFAVKGELERYPAYTVAELGEMLPLRHKSGQTLSLVPGERFACGCTGDDEYKQFADTEADARAKMLIYLIENNLLCV